VRSARGVAPVLPPDPTRAPPGITLDTGALIAFERRHLAIRKVYAQAVSAGFGITAPTVVVAEWWRAGHREKERAKLLRSVRVGRHYNWGAGARDKACPIHARTEA
jgi:hypothetical protein